MRNSPSNRWHKIWTKRTHNKIYDASSYFGNRKAIQYYFIENKVEYHLPVSTSDRWRRISPVFSRYKFRDWLISKKLIFINIFMIRSWMKFCKCNTAFDECIGKSNNELHIVTVRFPKVFYDISIFFQDYKMSSE